MNNNEPHNTANTYDSACIMHVHYMAIETVTQAPEWQRVYSSVSFFKVDVLDMHMYECMLKYWWSFRKRLLIDRV